MNNRKKKSMMKFSNRILLIALVLGLSVLVSCKKMFACNEENISSAGENDSHNKGQNCMQCHVAGGEGEGCFNVAGTLYKADLQSSQTGGVVELYTEPNGAGTLKYTIAIDSKGNFYSTAKIDYTGLYPKVTSPSGASIYMSSPLSSGACNSCHSPSSSPLGLD